MAWVAALTKLAPMLGMLKGGGGGGGGSQAMGGGFDAAASRFAMPGSAGSVNGAPMLQTPAGYSNVQPGGYAKGNMIGMPAQQGGSQSEQKMGLTQLHDNIQKNVNGFFNGLREFGTALGGLDKTPLNNIRLTQPQVLNPADIQNPNAMALAALMAKIAGGN